MATICIGMPALNAGATIADALVDLTSQTFRDIEVVVCDNASDDDTARIAEEFARNDSRVRVIRFEERVDIMRSFRRAFDAAGAPFFMFAAADDRRDTRFIEKTLAVLQARPDLGACSARTEFIGEGRAATMARGTRAILGSHAKRVRNYFADPADNSRAFGLYRRDAMQNAFPESWYPSWDYVFLARTLAFGGQEEVREILMRRRLTPDHKYASEIDRFYRGRRLRWLSNLPVACAVWRDPAMPRSMGLLWNLSVFVLRSHEWYAERRAPRWAKLLRVMTFWIAPVGSAALRDGGAAGRT